MRIHELKIAYQMFPYVACGVKNFELRKNDRNFEKGDFLHLREYSTIDLQYQGGWCICEITYILRPPFSGLQDGYCIMGIKLISSSIILDK